MEKIRLTIVGFEDRSGLPPKECSQYPKTGKDKDVDSSLESQERNTAMLTP